MTATNIDITIEQGTDFQQTFPINDQSITSTLLATASAAMQVRTAYGDPNAIITLTSASAGLTIDATNRTITAVITWDVTSNMQPGSYVYDIRLIAGGKISRPVEGTVTITPEVTLVTFPLSQANPLTAEDGSTILTEEDGTTAITQES